MGVQKLLPGLYLKIDATPTEISAMLLITQNTTIPSPVVLDAIMLRSADRDSIYLLMTEVHGKTFDSVSEDMTSEEIAQVGLALKLSLEQLKTIKNPFSAQICSAAGGDIYAPQIKSRSLVPAFLNMTAFHEYMRNEAHKYWPSISWKLEKTFGPDYMESTFCHGDISPYNVLIHERKFSGLIDWETAAWMPAYWDYIAALMPPFAKSPEFHELINTAISPGYMDELEGFLVITGINQGIKPKMFDFMKRQEDTDESSRPEEHPSVGPSEKW
ncbi:hypothetical protein CALCODRAFT_499596 [Calocera cornea HHB12733]|uniref:Aminoglycoside phosphotransferase domain-containing protein n=1 Tax=Calocera cornea HHB12733 TaxID=1353952 RepID=A0A165EE09_9BASI|nr:hypothetical protein CALCODRAFT_499596 [Calocera cornea HHB12733]